jgi:DNA polymerase III epsilon subunit family exonuclease
MNQSKRTDQRRHHQKRRHGGKKRALLNIPRVSGHIRTTVERPLAEGRYIVFDIETTGGNPERNGITEICALRYEDGKVVDKFYSMVNPEIPIPPIVRRMTGINNQMVRSAPKIDEIMPQFLSFVGSDILVSHNTIGDMKFIRHFAKVAANVDMENFYICTHLLVEKLAPEAPDKSLRGLAKYFAINAGELHRAEADAVVTLDLFKVLLGRLGDQQIATIDAAIRLQGDIESSMRLGWRLQPQLLASVPSGPGVFSLFDQQDRLMFTSSAIHLNREVGRLKVFDQLPRPLLKLVLKAADLKVSRTDNSFAAMLAECKAVQEAKLTFQPALWHQRILQTIYIAAHEGELVIGVGAIVPGTIHAFGPVRDRRIAAELIDAVGLACGVEATRHGLKLPLHLLPLLESFFRGELDNLKSGKAGWRQALMRLFKPATRRSDDDLQKTSQKLRETRIPAKLSPIFDVSGLVVVPGESSEWQVHQIVRGHPQAVSRVSLDWEDENWLRHLASEFAVTLEREHNRDQEKPLSEHDANRVNATLWWIFNGKFEGRFVPLADLLTSRS